MVREDTCLKGIDVETHVEAGGGGNLDVIDLFASPSAALLRSKPPAAQVTETDRQRSISLLLLRRRCCRAGRPLCR
jgi:hypothetical protein